MIPSMFQFHFGLIKRRKVAFDGYESVEFQFHFGLIKRYRSETKNVDFLCVSIPFWSD